MDELAPWLHHVHSKYKLGELRQFVDINCFGMLLLEKDSKLFTHVIGGMAQSAQNVGIYYKITGLWILKFLKPYSHFIQNTTLCSMNHMNKLTII